MDMEWNTQHIPASERARWHLGRESSTEYYTAFLLHHASEQALKSFRDLDFRPRCLMENGGVDIWPRRANPPHCPVTTHRCLSCTLGNLETKHASSTSGIQSVPVFARFTTQARRTAMDLRCGRRVKYPPLASHLQDCHARLIKPDQ